MKRGFVSKLQTTELKICIDMVQSLWTKPHYMMRLQSQNIIRCSHKITNVIIKTGFSKKSDKLCTRSFKPHLVFLLKVSHFKCSSRQCVSNKILSERLSNLRILNFWRSYLQINFKLLRKTSSLYHVHIYALNFVKSQVKVQIPTA